MIRIGYCLLTVAMAQGKMLFVSLQVWNLIDLRRRPEWQRVKQVVSGVTCEGPGVTETGGAGDGIKGWQRAANYFFGGVVLITLCVAFLLSIVAPAYQTPRQ